MSTYHARLDEDVVHVRLSRAELRRLLAWAYDTEKHEFLYASDRALRDRLRSLLDGLG